MPSGDLVVEHWYKALPAGDAEAVCGKVKKSISIPPAVKFYRAFMGGVDLFDQYRAYVYYATEKFQVLARHILLLNYFRGSFGECLECVQPNQEDGTASP